MLISRKPSTSDDINIVGIAITFVASILSIAFTIAMWRLAVATWRLHRQSQQRQRDLEANEYVFSLVVGRKRR